MGLHLLSILLFVCCNGLEKAVKVVIGRVVELLKGIESSSQVHAKPWRIVVAYGALVKMELVFVVIGEEGYFL